MYAHVNQHRHRARSLTLLPLSASLGLSLGPLLGGFFASDFRKCIAASSCHYPFAVPSVIIAGYCALIALLVLFAIGEGSDMKKASPNPFIASQNPPRTVTQGTPATPASQEVDVSEIDPLLPTKRSSSQQSHSYLEPSTSTNRSIESERLIAVPFRKIWTTNVIYTMLATFLVAGNLGTFITLWPLFLSAPRQDSRARHSSINLSGGLDLNARQVAICMSLLGIPSIVLQISIYPTLSDRYGTTRVWRFALFLFPLTYLIASITTVTTPTSSKLDTATNKSPILWFMVLFVLSLFIAGRTGVAPATTMLINDCTPHARLRGTIHTIGTVFSNLGRSIFPAIVLPIFGYGLKKGITGLGFWFLTVIAVIPCMFSGYVGQSSDIEDF